MRFRGITAFIAGAALAASVPLASAYVRLQTQFTDSTPNVFLSRPDNTAIQFYINSQLVSGFQSSASGSNVTIIAPGSDPVAAVRAALASWNASGANVRFLPLQSTTLVNSTTDGKMVISLAATSQDISFVGGAVAVTANSYAAGSGQDPDNPNLTVVAGNIIDSDILLNPTITFSTDGSGSPTGLAKVNGSLIQDFQAVITHELGHALGANHSGLLSDTMFQYAGINERLPGQDDIAFVKSLYPPSGGLQFGTISGTVSVSGGGPVAFGLLTFIDTQQNLTLGGLTNADGTYSVQVPAGDYAIYAEPANELIQPGNLYLTTAQAAQVTTFETTFNGSPSTTVKVTAGNATTASFSANAGTAKLALPYVGFGTPGKKGDVKTYAQIGGPIPLASGQTVDLVIGGIGIDNKATFAMLGGGVSVSAPLQDSTSLNITGGPVPLFRLTLTVQPTLTSVTSSLVITEGSTILSLSGLFVVTPPTPAFTSASLVSAASYAGPGGNGGVSPGGIYSLYATQGTSNLGPATPVVNGGYDAYGYLPGQLSGVSVTFDGVPAPLFFVAGGQINLQVPFEVYGKVTTNVVVNYFGAVNTAVAVSVSAIQPEFFTVTPLGADSILVNADGSINSSTHVAKVGDYVTAYGTGVGITPLGTGGYGLQTGVGAPAPPGGFSGNFTCSFGSITTNAYFGGYTPTAVGLAQWTVQVPAGATGKLKFKCTDTASGTSTQDGTIYVN